MEVILLERVAKLGQMGEIVKVRDGFARNFLLRRKKALRATALPPSTLAALSVALAFCFAGGMLGLFSKVIASALVMTYALIGFAVLHTLTLALRSRPFILSSTYVVVVMFSWPVLLVAALRIADAVFGLRQRYLRSRPPPLPAP